MIASLRPLIQLPLASEKMAKVSELYDVTWEGNYGRGGCGKTKRNGKRFGILTALGDLLWSLFGTGALTGLGELRR